MSRALLYGVRRRSGLMRRCRVKITLLGLLLLAVSLPQAVAGAASAEVRPSEASIRRLLEVTQAHKLIDGMSQQVDAMFAGMLQKQFEGRDLSAQQRAAIDKMRGRLADLMKENFSWDSMEAIYLEVYQKSFSQSEVDDMIKFYRTPAGQAVVLKLPVVMKNTMAILQQRMQALTPKIQQMAADTAAEVKAQQP
ncbi:MAG: DUF2059 domain-containing protein [Gammaproteobacteria bacterium]|nr:DUF2059 domain-containing protein [Gammaproteobacteria bacterium]